MIADQYLDDQGVETRRRTPAEGPTLQTRMGAELRVNENRFGSLEMTIADVRFFDRKGQEITGLHHGSFADRHRIRRTAADHGAYLRCHHQPRGWIDLL